jgi:amidase
MAFRLPDHDELQALAAELGQELDNDAADALLSYFAPFREGFQYLETEAGELPPVRYPARNFQFPEPNENPLGAWYVKTELKGATKGPLNGKRVAVKDSIFVADVPMMYGTSVLEGFKPDFDATVITRLLDAGAEITGKAVCEYLCLSGGSVTASNGFVRNPHDPDYSAGGSSSGSAALVASGAVNIALGTDQAGSVRIPSSWCGTVGMKATHGLVPYTGIPGMEASVDHVGPITATVADNALALEVLAGADGLDGRQREPQVNEYAKALGKSVAGMKIGVLREGFSQPASAAAVDESVRAGAARFTALGADVEEISVPMHLPGAIIWSGVVIESVCHALQMGGVNFNVDSVCSPAMADAMLGWQSRLHDVPVNVLMVLVFGRYMERYGGQYYARAKNLVPRLRQAYDRALAEYDLLLLPTTITQASRLPASREQMTDDYIVQDLFSTSANACQFNITGHPAISVPCGISGGLPVGMMLVAKHFDEPTLYRAAFAFEQVK